MGQVSVAIALLLVLCAAPVRAESQLDRGRYLVETLAGCGNCHTPRGPTGPLKDKKFAGGEVIKHADFTAVTPNITPDPQTGIGKWTDDQIALAIREGRRPDGRLLGPAMPSRSYRSLTTKTSKRLSLICAASHRSTIRSPPSHTTISHCPPVGALRSGMSMRRRSRTRSPMASTSQAH